jgi:O-antigen/teichoic acid export membrane protein
MSIRRHTAYNLLGSLVPMVIGVVTVPIYLRLIGDVRYGVLALVWLFLGYFGLFDPGITRAALFHIARLGSPSQERERESVFWTALAINICFGLVGGLALYLAATPFFMTTFKMPASMRSEVLASLPWLAASVPVSIVTGVLGGALQAREGFGAFNLINAGTAMVSQLAPLAVAHWHGPDLRWLIATVLITRGAAAIPMLIALASLMPLWVGGRFEKARVRTLFTYGGWVTISNLINPILTTMDRIGSVIGAQAVAIYTVPFNLVSRISILPASFATSLFPKLSRGDRESSARLAEESIVALSAVMTPLVVGVIAVLHIFMRYWVGADFASRAAPVGVILLAGVWINGLAIIPFEHLQAIDRPDLTAKFHAIEVLPFLGILWVGLHTFGLVGAAWAWTLRVTVDALLLIFVAGQTKGWQRMIPGGVLVLAATLVVPTTILSWRSGAEIVLLIVALLSSWYVSPLLRLELQKRFARKQEAPVA